MYSYSTVWNCHLTCNWSLGTAHTAETNFQLVSAVLLILWPSAGETRLAPTCRWRSDSTWTIRIFERLVQWCSSSRLCHTCPSSVVILSWLEVIVLQCHVRCLSGGSPCLIDEAGRLRPCCHCISARAGSQSLHCRHERQASWRTLSASPFWRKILLEKYLPRKENFIRVD